jgi:membrane-associated protein
MTDWLLALVPTYGPWLLAAATFLSCVALPIPASILMLAAGGFVAAGDLTLATTCLAALAGAVLGDQAGFAAGRFGLQRALARGEGETAGQGAGLLHRARDLLARRGGLAVFLSRWLVSALGPYVNLAAGGAGLAWGSFTLWSVLGEAVWVGLYVGLGYTFTGNLEAASAQAVNVLGLLGAGAVALGLGAWLLSRLRADATTSGRS